MTATGRYLIMLPNNSNNLSDFLELYKHNTAFYISPAFYDNSGIPKPVLGLAILKHHLTVKSFINLNKNDPEYWLIKKSQS
ncbi:MAG: hypothetical protein IPK86_02835 [Neisseriales bacterium]|nr:MAG: hypothetical protein IPK86_02835 [Neisseriales bacterium]